MNSYETLAARLDTITKLKKLKESVDPAAGMSICIRTGLLSDQAEDDHNRPLRQWIQLETCENMSEIINSLIETQLKSAALWRRFVAEDMCKAHKALNDADTQGIQTTI